MDNFRQSLKLPSVQFGSVDQNTKTFDRHLWASNERMNIIEILKSGDEITADKWFSLKGHILETLKEALKGEKLSVWHELHVNLVALVPLCWLISQDKEIISLFRSISVRLNENLEWSYSLPGFTDTLSLFLPSVNLPAPISTEQKTELVVPRSIRKNISKAPSNKIMPVDTNNWFVDPITGDLFDPTTIATNVSNKVRRIKMKDILASIGNVGSEIAMNESAFQRPFEQMIKAMNIDMTRFGYSDVSGIDTKLRSVDEFYDLDNELPVTEISELKPEKKGVDLLELPKCGREGVVYMIKCFHLKEMRLAYFNVKERRIVDYYSLIAVKKFQVNKEHYIFSSVGIIHQHEDGTGQAMSLTDWYKESILYYALRCLPFIRSFLMRKHFQSWLKWTVHKRHRRKGQYLERRLLVANVVFGKSLLQILKLLDEISRITLVPRSFGNTLTEVTFLKEFANVGKSADVFLGKFYKYIKLVVDETAAECYKHLQFCQAQAHNVYLYSEDSIYLKNLKQQERQRALSQSMAQVHQLGDFVRLVNYLLSRTVVDMTLHNITIFAELLASLNVDGTATEALFQSSLMMKVIDSDHKLTFSPSVTEVEELFEGRIAGIPQMILRHCYPFDGLLSTEYLTRYQEVISGSFGRSKRVPTILSSAAEVRTQMMDDWKPELPIIDLPSKSEDDLRVATPPNVNPNVVNKTVLTVIGQAIPSTFSPMTRSNVSEILDSSPQYLSLTNGFKDIFKETEGYLNLLSKESEWLLGVRAEYDEWCKIDMVVDWAGQSPYLFEQRLGRVRNFLVQLNVVEKSTILPNRMFIISFEKLLLDLIAEMEFELDSIFYYVLSQVRSLGSTFIKDITTVLEILRLRKTEPEIFMRVAIHIVECRENSGRYQASVDYIKSLFDVLKVTDKWLDQSDKDIEDQVTSLWESFLFQLQEANEFINSEKPNVIFSIKSRIQELERSANSIAESLNDQCYSNLSEDRATILSDIMNKWSKMEQIKAEIEVLVNCYQSLQLETYIHSIDIHEIIRRAEFLYSQWNLLDEAIRQIHVWKKTLFSQFDVPIVSDLILDWQRRIVDMRSKDDHQPNIVKEIEEIVGDFASFMSLFGKLSSPLFQLEHWQRFFSDLGHDFIDPYEVLTVGDLIAIDIRQYAATIDVLFSNAVLRNKASAEFEHHLRFWMTREFDFLRHYSQPWFRSRHDADGTAISRGNTSLKSVQKSDAEMYYEGKALSEKREKLSRLPLTNNKDKTVFLVAQFTKLHEDISDSLIALPNRDSIASAQYRVLYSALEELQRLAEILEQCQERWAFLEKVFEEEYFVRTYPEAAQRFLDVNNEFLCSLAMVQYTPTAIQHTRSGQTFLALKSINVTETQLVHRLRDLLSIMTDLMSCLAAVFYNARTVFPRLFFLTDAQVAKALSCDINQSLEAMSPIVRLCFPDIAEVVSDGGLSIVSVSGERVPLKGELSSSLKAAQWLKEFEIVLKSSLKSFLGSCLAQQLTDSRNGASGSQFFVTERPKSTVFDEIDQIESFAHRMPKDKQLIADDLVHDILHHYQSWLLRFPLQTLLLTEDIIFYKSLMEPRSYKFNNFPELRSKLVQKENNFLRLMNSIDTSNSSRVAVQHLLMENWRHIDIIDKLIDDVHLTVDSFTYQSLIRYHWDMGDTRTKTTPPLDVCGEVKIEMLSHQFFYEFEYADMWRRAVVPSGTTERSLVNMITSLGNYETGTMIGNSGACKETFAEIARNLGRNMFSMFCDDQTAQPIMRQYMTGAILSGTILHLDRFDQLRSSVISEMSRDTWSIRQELKKGGGEHVFLKKIRPLSATSTLIKSEEDVIINSADPIYPYHDRDGSQRRNTDHSVLEFRDEQNRKITKGKSTLFNSGEEIFPEYSPHILSQIHLYESLLDIRYGFGTFSTVNKPSNFQQIPLTMKTQMRTHVLIPVDGSLLWKQCLILGGRERSQDISTSINSFIKMMEDFHPESCKCVKKLLPFVLSNFAWPTDDVKSKLGQYLLEKFNERFSPGEDYKYFLEEAIRDSFSIKDVAGSNLQEDSSALIHQLKSQLRVRGMKVCTGFIDTMIELKRRVYSNKVTVLTGGPCSGKTSALDILSASINGLYSSAQSILSGSKKRGAIDILKTISQERKPHLNHAESEEFDKKRIFLLPLSLSNFATEKLSSDGLSRDALSAITTLVGPVLKSAATDKFQIWLHVDQGIFKELPSLVHPLTSLFQNDSAVKIIVEIISSPYDQFHSNQELFGLVHMECIPDLWKIILKKNIKQFLGQKLITYYGCNLLVETGKILFQGLFDSLELPLKCAQDDGAHINCVRQSMEVLSVVLRQYSRYHPQEKEDNLETMGNKYTALLCFSIIQGARGILYSVMIGQRLLNVDEFEDKLMKVISVKCQISMTKDDVNVGIFGLMVDFNSLTLKPYEDVRGCKLLPLWSNSDGVAKYLIHAMVKDGRSLVLNGSKSTIEAMLDTVTFNKRLHLSSSHSSKDVRKCLQDKSDQYWKILSNEDPLGTRPRPNYVLVLERFYRDNRRSQCTDQFLTFLFEHKFYYDEEFCDKVLAEDAVIIAVNYGHETVDRERSNYSKVARWATELNIIDPSFVECRRIAHKSFGRWLQKLDKQKDSLSKVVSKRLGDFVVDVGQSLRQHRIRAITAATSGLSCPANVHMDQLTWGHLCKVIRALTAVPVDVLQSTVKSLEKTFPLEKSDSVKNCRKYSIYIRIMRHVIFELARSFIDIARGLEEVDLVNRLIHESVERNLSQTIAHSIDSMILKHFPVAVDRITDIVLWPCRLIDAGSYSNNSEVNYQPIVEAHSWQMLNNAQEAICHVLTTEDHVKSGTLLSTMLRNADFLSSIMRMYRHLSTKNCRPSALFVEYCSSVIGGYEYGHVLSALLSAEHIRPEDIVDDASQLITRALQSAGRCDHKVLLHIDLSCVRVTQTVLETIENLLCQDSLVPFLQHMHLPLVHRCVREVHADLYIPAGSPKETRLSKAFLENVQRNLKIMITCTTTQMVSAKSIRTLSEYFRETEMNYIRVEDCGEEAIEECVHTIVPTHTIPLARVHQFLANTFHKFEISFGRGFSINGAHLKLASLHYAFLHSLSSDLIKEEMDTFGAALESVVYAWREVEVMKGLRDTLQDSLKKLNDEVDASGQEGKNMRDIYANALVQCKGQEKKVAELFGPLNEMKEKSKSNLDDVSPTYLAALETIRNLDPDAVEEIKTYVKPPQQVRDLIGIIFDLLGHETKWEQIKERMVKINLYEDLLYLDKDHISDDQFKKLELGLMDPQLSTDSLENVSRAAASLSMWLTAVYRYSSLNREINPQLGQLLSFQDQINRAQTELGKMRVRADLLRQELERKIAEHKELLSRRKNVAENLKSITYKINSGINVLSDMGRHVEDWKRRTERLKEELNNLSLNVLATVVRSVYLNKLPHSLRAIIMEPLQDLGLDFKAPKTRLVQDQDYRDLLQQNAWSPVHRNNVLSAVEMTSMVYSPAIAYPDLGSIIVVHCSNTGLVGVEQLILAVLQSESITATFCVRSDALTTIHYKDCSKCSEQTIDEELSLSMSQGYILVLDKAQLLSELSPGMHTLLSNPTVSVNPSFRLLLITQDSYSDDLLFSSERFLHTNFTCGRHDFEDLLERALVGTCEPEVYHSILSCKIQRFELDKSTTEEKDQLTAIAVSCAKKSPSKPAQRSNKLSTVAEKTSLLEVDGLHSLILKIDSKVNTFDEGRDSIKEKEKNLEARIEKYEIVKSGISLLLHSFNVFLLDKMITYDDGSQLVATRMSIDHAIEMVSEVVVESVKGIVMTRGSDPEITEMFLERLLRQIMVALVGEIYVRMGSVDVWECVLEFCVDTMIVDGADLANCSDVECAFIRRAILCRDTDELIVDVDPGLLDGYDLTKNSCNVPRQMVLLSLVLETNIIVLGGLTNSLLNDQPLWREYFQLQFMSCNFMPGFDIGHQPGLLLKTVIWRVLNPQNMEQVRALLVAHVFGEEIFRTKFGRNRSFESIVSRSIATQPIIVSAQKHATWGVPSPLEIISHVHETSNSASRIRVIDCANPSELTKLMSSSSSHIVRDGEEQDLHINRLLMEPSWIVLSNLHLSSTGDHFHSSFFKKILKNHMTRQPMKSHCDSRLFLTLELDSFDYIPESVLVSGSLFHCSTELDRDTSVEQCVASTLPSRTKAAYVAALLHVGMFSSQQFHRSSTSSFGDFEETVNILSKIDVDRRSLKEVLKLTCGNKFLRDDFRQLFDKTTSEMCDNFGDYIEDNISETALRRAFYNTLCTNIPLCLEATEQNAGKLARGHADTYCLVNQRTIETVRSNVAGILSLLLWIVDQPIGVNGSAITQRHSLRMDLTAVAEVALALPVLRMRSVSTLRFDERLTWSDLERLEDQVLISNDLVPRSWRLANWNPSATVSQWVDAIKTALSNCEKMVLDPDAVLAEGTSQNIRKCFHHRTS